MLILVDGPVTQPIDKAREDVFLARRGAHFWSFWCADSSRVRRPPENSKAEQENAVSPAGTSAESLFETERGAVIDDLILVGIKFWRLPRRRVSTS